MERAIRIHMQEIAAKRDADIELIVSRCKSGDLQAISESANVLATISTNFILAVFEFEYRQVDREGPSQLLICVGTEMLLNAIIVLKAPEAYVDLYAKKGRPPSFEQAKVCARGIIVAAFDESRRDRMTDVLDLIHNKRNTFAHFSLGFHARYYQHYEMLNVLEYLFSTYFPLRTRGIERVREMKERLRMKSAPDYDYIDFRPNPSHNFV